MHDIILDTQEILSCAGSLLTNPFEFTEQVGQNIAVDFNSFKAVICARNFPN